MKYKHIEAAREVRLWIAQIIVPAAVAVGSMMTVPEVRQMVAEKANEIKNRSKRNKSQTFPFIFIKDAKKSYSFMKKEETICLQHLKEKKNY